MNNGNNLTLLLLDITQELEAHSGWNLESETIELIQTSCPDIFLLVEKQDFSFYKEWAGELIHTLPGLDVEKTSKELAKFHGVALGFND